MADYDSHLKALAKAYILANVEHQAASRIATKELKPHKARLDRHKEEIGSTFGPRNWTCVQDPISKMYVTRLRVGTPKPLTTELMRTILHKVMALHNAKSSTWKSVKEAVDDTTNLIHTLRQSDKFTIAVKPKPPGKHKVVHLRAELSKEKAYSEKELRQYDQWLHAFVASHRSLKEKEKGISEKKKALKTKFEGIASDVESVFRKNHYTSVPVRCERKISSEFQDVVVMTGSNYLSQKVPRKIKRYLEYLPVPRRNTTVKKFSPGKKQVTMYLTKAAGKIKRMRDLDVVKLVQAMFEDLQEEARKANEKKLRDAEAHPQYRLKVSMKKTSSKKARPPKRAPLSSSQPQPRFKRRSK